LLNITNYLKVSLGLALDYPNFKVHQWSQGTA